MLQSRRKPKASSVNYVIDLTILFPKDSGNIGKTLLVEMDIDWHQSTNRIQTLHTPTETL